MRRVDFHFLNGSWSAQTHDRPVVAGLAPAARLPAVAHVDAAPRTIEIADLAVVLIVRDQADAAILDREEVDAMRTDLPPVRAHLAPDTKPCNAAIRKNVDAQEFPAVAVIDLEQVVAIPLQGALWKKRVPARFRFEGIGIIAHFHRGLRRKVAGEVARVEIDQPDDAAQSQPDDRRIVTAVAAPTRFPPIHPLTMGIEGARPRDRLGAAQHAFLRGEEIVSDQENISTECILL